MSALGLALWVMCITLMCCLFGFQPSKGDGELYYVVQYRKNSPVGMSTLKSIHNFTKKAKSKTVLVEHFYKTNFDLLNNPTKPTSTVRFKLTLNRDLVLNDVYDDNFSLPVENCHYHGNVPKFMSSTIALSTCGDSIGLNGLLVRNNETLWISPEKSLDLVDAMMDDAKYHSEMAIEEEGEHVPFVPPLAHRVRLYGGFQDGRERCATLSSLNFHGFGGNNRNSKLQPHLEKHSASENFREHRLALAVRIDHALVNTLFRGDSKLATNNVLSALNIADLLTRRFGLQLVVSSIRQWPDGREENETSSLTGNQTGHNFSSTSARMNLHRLIAYNKDRLRELLQQESSTSYNSEFAPPPSVLVVFSGVAASHEHVTIPLDACVPFSICSSEMHRAVIFVSATRSTSPPQLNMASSFLHQLAHAIGFGHLPSDDSTSSHLKCPSCSMAWQCLGSATNGDVRSYIAPLLACHPGSDSLHGVPNLACLLPMTSPTVHQALLGVSETASAHVGVEDRDWHSLSMSDSAVPISRSQLSLTPQQNRAHKKNFCGDGIVGDSEECDCHVDSNGKALDAKAVAECQFKSCCDAATCLLSEWAQCSPLLASECCTENCTLRPAESICRAAKSACDLPEQCTTLNGRCPSDRFVANGFSCLSSTTQLPQLPDYWNDKDFSSGVCYAGSCRSRDVACQNLWGSTAKSGHNKCYDALCESTSCEDVFCDHLQCQVEPGADATPQHNDLTFVVSRLHGTTELDSVVECRRLVLRGNKQNKSLNALGFVPDWSPCGQGHVCYNKRCVEITTLDVASCPVGTVVGLPEELPCSGNGWCTLSELELPQAPTQAVGRCICKPFWTGTACELPLHAPGVWPDTVTRSAVNSTGVAILGGFGSWMTERLLLTAVVPCVGLILIAFGFFVACYRRKLIVIRPSRRKSKRKPVKNRSSSSFKGGAEGQRLDDIQSPVLLCTTGMVGGNGDVSKFGGNGETEGEPHEGGDADVSQLVPPNPMLNRQPERGILKKKSSVAPPPVQQQQESTMTVITQQIGVCRVDPNAAAAAMAAMMRSYDLSGQENSTSDGTTADVDESATAALRHLSQQFANNNQNRQSSRVDMSMPPQEGNNNDGQMMMMMMMNGNNRQEQEEDAEDGNDNDDEEDDAMSGEGVMQLASLRQIVALRRTNPAYSNQTPPCPPPMSNGNTPCYTKQPGEIMPNSTRPDVISTCVGSPSANAARTGSNPATIPTNCSCRFGCSNCRPGTDPSHVYIMSANGNKYLPNEMTSSNLMNHHNLHPADHVDQSGEMVQSPLEQLLNHIEQKFSSTLGHNSGGTLPGKETPAGTGLATHRPILFTNSLLAAVSTTTTPNNMTAVLTGNDSDMMNTSSLRLHPMQMQQPQHLSSTFVVENSSSNNVFTASTSLSSAILGMSPSVESNTSVSASITQTEC